MEKPNLYILGIKLKENKKLRLRFSKMFFHLIYGNIDCFLLVIIHEEAKTYQNWRKN